MSFPLELDFIGWADLRELKQSLDQGDQRVRASVRRIVHPINSTSAFYDGKVVIHTLRMLAACHDHRVYKTPFPVNEYFESDSILGLGRYSYEGKKLDFQLITQDEDAYAYAKALVAITNVLLSVTYSVNFHPLSAALRADNEEVWIVSQPILDLVLRHSRNIDPVLTALDERHTLDPDEIDSIVANGNALGAGTL